MTRLAASPPRRLIDLTEDDLEHLVRRIVRETGPSAFVDLREAGRIAGVHPKTVAEWIRQKRLRRYNAGKRPRVKVSELEELLASPPAPPESRSDAVVRKLVAKARGDGA